MARLAVESERLILRLNPVEKIATFKRNIVVSLRAISDVSVQHDPWGAALLDLRLGFAAGGAPLQRVATAMSCRTSDGERAMVVVYLNRPSVVVRLGSGSPWRLLVVSTPSPETEANRIRAAAGL